MGAEKRGERETASGIHKHKGDKRRGCGCGPGLEPGRPVQVKKDLWIERHKQTRYAKTEKIMDIDSKSPNIRCTLICMNHRERSTLSCWLRSNGPSPCPHSLPLSFYIFCTHHIYFSMPGCLQRGEPCLAPGPTIQHKSLAFSLLSKDPPERRYKTRRFGACTRASYTCAQASLLLREGRVG